MVSEDDFVEAKRAPVPLHIVDSDCANDNNEDGNWLVALFSNLYRHLVICNQFKPTTPEIRRSPPRKPKKKKKKDRLIERYQNVKTINWKDHHSK
jgi:hypothetical protein